MLLTKTKPNQLHSKPPRNYTHKHSYTLLIIIVVHSVMVNGNAELEVWKRSACIGLQVSPSPASL